jgi:CheY-like chemotaxis protein/HPt (histidine-containing phosphotransfer) domain-containing protein
MKVPARKLRVLLVEDNHVNQRVAARILKRMGHDADLAADGVEAVAQVQARTYDVVLMDMQMPRMDGLEATRRLRAMGGPTARIPVIALTASALVSDEQRCRQAGMDHFLSKPLRKQDLADTLRAALPAPADEQAPHPRHVEQPDRLDSHPLLDPAVLAELRELPPAFLTRLVTSYVRNAHGAAGDITIAARDNDLPQLTRLAHRLRGSSGTLAGHKLAATCARLEHAVEDGDATTVQILARHVVVQTQEFCAALQAEVETAPSAGPR